MKYYYCPCKDWDETLLSLKQVSSINLYHFSSIIQKYKFEEYCKRVAEINTIKFDEVYANLMNLLGVMYISPNTSVINYQYITGSDIVEEIIIVVSNHDTMQVTNLHKLIQPYNFIGIMGVCM